MPGQGQAFFGEGSGAEGQGKEDGTREYIGQGHRQATAPRHGPFVKLTSRIWMIDEPPATEEVADDRGQQQREHERRYSDCNQRVHRLEIGFRLSGLDFAKWDRSAECKPVTQGNEGLRRPQSRKQFRHGNDRVVRIRALAETASWTEVVANLRSLA